MKAWVRRCSCTSPSTRDAVVAVGEEQSDEVQWFFVARVDPRTKAQVDEEIVLAVDADAIHFFDLDTGLAVRS